MAIRIAYMKDLVLLFATCLAARPLTAQSQRAACFRYGPDTVRITGTLNRHMYYGAPGYGEDPKRDEKEIGFYLDLSTPACTVAGSDDIDVAKKNIRRIQLVLDQRGYDALRPFLRKKVTLRGTLFGAITGHHHTPALLSVPQPAHVEP
jgi:hypothetical protein